MRWRLPAYVLAVAGLVAWSPVVGATATPRAAPAAEAGCADLGEAANFSVFSNDAFNASQASGTSITGRIAAAGDVRR